MITVDQLPLWAADGAQGSGTAAPALSGVLSHYSASGDSLASGGDFQPLESDPLTGSKADGVAGLLAARPDSPGHVSWVVYTRDHARQSLADALLDSVRDHTARYGRPTAVLMHPDNVLALAPTADAEAGLLVYVTPVGGVRVQPGTWGLA